MPKLTNDQLIVSIQSLSEIASYTKTEYREPILDRMMLMIDELAARSAGVKADGETLSQMLAEHGIKPFVDMYEFESEERQVHVVTIDGEKK